MRNIIILLVLGALLFESYHYLPDTIYPQILICVIIASFILMIVFAKTPFAITSHWQHFFDGIQFSSAAFYSRIQDDIKERKIPNVAFKNKFFLESHAFSAKREYLRVTRGEYVFYVCAAAYGTGTFVSWWQCVKDERLINRIPILSKLLGKDRKDKTFYQMDTEGMFCSAIHTSVLSVAGSMTGENGIRLTELERQYKTRR